jgi:DNA-binding NarL/FixJ family response regulator
MGGTPDDRLLLRGLLRLHRHRVAAEIPAVDALRDLVPSDERKVLIFQVDPTGAGWCDDLAAALARDPSMLAVVLTRGRSPEFDRRATGAGARAVLQRPFTVRDLVATVEAVGRGENLLGTPALRDSEEARQG